MTRLDDRANVLYWSELERKAAIAPKGTKRQREKAVREFAHRLLRQDVRAGTEPHYWWTEA